MAREESDELVWVCSMPLLTLFNSIVLLFKAVMLLIINDCSYYLDVCMDG